MDKTEIIEKLNAAYFSSDPHEAKILRHFAALLADAKVFVDLGASLGQFTKLANEQMRNGQIVAVEADPLRFEELEKNARIWAASNSNGIRVLHAAISDKVGQLSFQVTNSSVSGGLFRHDLRHTDVNTQASVNWQEITVAALTLDDLFPGPPPDVVKMDIEGAEYLALKGAAKVLQAGKTTWFIELHDFALTEGRSTSDMVVALMQQHGYRCVELDYNARCLFLKRPWRTVPLLCVKAMFFRSYRLGKRIAKKIVGRR